MVKTGYQRYEDHEEPIILEPEDWTPEEWAALCKMAGDLPPDRTERIVWSNYVLETYVARKPSKSQEFAEPEERTYTVTEVCPHCEAEVSMQWNTDIDGFKAICPHCGGRLMLCDECHQIGGGRCDYDRETDSCYRNPPQGELSDDKVKRLVELGDQCFECGSTSCGFVHNGYCRFPLVHERMPRMTADDGCVDYDFKEGQ